MKLTPEFESDIRRAVNPLYVNQRGTESYERAALLGEIDRLRAASSVLVEALNTIDAVGITIYTKTRFAMAELSGRNQCRKCGANMQPGVAMGQTLVGIPDMGEVCTVSPGGKGDLIKCIKCRECGWSTT